jgi:subtilase family serine protease
MLSKLPFQFALLTCSTISFCLTPAVLAQSASAQSGAQAHPRALITQPIDSAVLVTLAGNTRGEATASNDLGKVDDSFAMEHMLLQLQRGPEGEKAVQAFVDQQHDPKSPNFHKWLTAEEFGKRFGSAQQDIDKITSWLTSNGFTVNTVYPSGMTIDFSGTAGQVLNTFHTEIHKLSVKGVSHISNMSDPQIPAALAPAVAGIVSLHDFHPHAMLKPRAKYTATYQGVTYQAVTPADLATIYDLNPAFAAGYTGTGQTIAVVEDSDLYRASDWSTFRTTFGLSGYTSGTLNTVHPAPPSGKTNCADPGVNSDGDDAETTADAEWATAAAPNAAIQIAACNSTTTSFGVIIALQNLVNESNPPHIISMSYGECEAANGATANALMNTIMQQGVSEGISIFVSAGDEGAASCDADEIAASHGIGISAYASTPYNVAVGGTDFGDTYAGKGSTYWSTSNSATYGSALSYIPEIPWNASCAGSLLAKYSGFSTSYGTNGFCGSAEGENFLGVGGGSGGPSGCATGSPSAAEIVSGTCQGYPKPSWQAGTAGNPSDGVRDIPDVSLFASNGLWNHYYVECFTDISNGGAACTGAPINWAGGGGTSFSSPIMAGIQALVNQKLGASQGNPNPVLYALAASSVASTVFHTVNSGDIVQNCSGTIGCYGIGFVGRGRSASGTEFDGNGALSTSGTSYSPAYAANGAWSFATGIGSVDAYNLIMNWTKGQ